MCPVSNSVNAFGQRGILCRESRSRKCLHFNLVPFFRHKITVESRLLRRNDISL